MGMIQQLFVGVQALSSQLPLKMATEHALPSLNITITPSLGSASSEYVGNSSLSIRMDMDIPSLAADDPILNLDRLVDNVPSQPYDDHSLTFYDDSGILPTYIQGDENDPDSTKRTWRVSRPTRDGRVSVHFTAIPRQVDKDTKIGSRIDLRYEGGGLQGAAMTILPTPVFANAEETDWKLQLVWDFNDTPAGTRGVWTWGEGPDAVSRVGPLGDLQNSMFSVGPINSYPIDHNSPFGIYWFGELPPNIARLNGYEKDIFNAMSDFWNDPLSPDNPYRLFIRCATPAKSFGGTATRRAYVLEYDDAVDKVSEDDLTLLITHEMVHNWPHMGSRGENASDAYDEGMWFQEGVADFYAAVMPHKFGFRDAAWLKMALNRYLSKYYTSPAIRVPNEEAVKKFWESPSAAMVVYSRGFAYLVKLHAQIHAKHADRLSLDDLVMVLVLNRRQGRDYSVAEWRRLLLEHLGEEAIGEYEAMTEGAVVVPPPTWPGQEWELVRHDLEMFDLGFDVSSLMSTRVISGLKPDSRAAEAGIRDGDEIVKSISMWGMNDHHHNMNTMTLHRPSQAANQTFEVTYWPRTREKVMCYQYA